MHYSSKIDCKNKETNEEERKIRERERKRECKFLREILSLSTNHERKINRKVIDYKRGR